MAHVQADATDQQLTDEDLPPHVAVVEVRSFIIIEKQIVVRDVQFLDAMQLMFCLFFDLNLEYSQQKKTARLLLWIYAEILMELEGSDWAPKLQPLSML